MAWALVSLSGLHAARKLSVPLRGGPLARRLTLQQCAAAAVAAAAAAGPGSEPGPYPAAQVAGANIRDARLAVRLAPLSAADAAGAALLPAAAVLSLPAAKAVACYRQQLAEELATAEVGGWGAVPRAASSQAFPPAGRERLYPLTAPVKVFAETAELREGGVVSPIRRAPPRWRQLAAPSWRPSPPSWQMPTSQTPSTGAGFKLDN